MQVTANYQIKYGLIARIKKDFSYNICTVKDNYLDDSIWFNIYITRKTSKNRDFKDDWTKRYYLDDGKNFDVLREIIKIIEMYLHTFRPKHIVLAAFEEDNWIKRMNFYLKILSRFGYSAFDHYDSALGIYNRKENPGVLLLTYTEDCKKIFIGAGFSEEKNDFYFYTKDGEKSFINWK